MSSDEQIPAEADVENVKGFDNTEASNEDSVNEVNDDEQVPQSDEQPTTEKEDSKSETT
ncbi:unnamed protein product, partial [Rotaria magnacalcarata]